MYQYDLWYVSLHVVPSKPAHHRSPTYSGIYQRSYCIPHGHLHTVTYTRFRIDTIDSPDVPSKPAYHTVTYIQ